MANLNIKINLLDLKCARRFEKSQSGLVECLIIPIEQNYLYVGEKGVYLDLSAFELKEKKGNKTHLIKQQLPKDVFKALTDEQKRDTPILGDVTTWEHTEPEPASNAASLQPDDDLPFA
jgi:hypothetical protein